MREGQMDLFSFIDNPYESIREKYTREGYTNVYDRRPDHPCEVDVIDHEGNRFRTRAVESFGHITFDTTKGRGYDICWWKEVVKVCRNCSHMRRCTSGFDGIYHGFACFGFGISKSNNIHNDACHDYKPATDGEMWRTQDKAVDEWLYRREDRT